MSYLTMQITIGCIPFFEKEMSISSVWPRNAKKPAFAGSCCYKRAVRVWYFQDAGVVSGHPHLFKKLLVASL
jgi:hypothetical protein